MKKNSIKIVDHFLSKEEFVVVSSKHNGILETRPKPSFENLPKYYDSPEYFSHNKNNSFFSFIYSLVKKGNFKFKLRVLRRFSSRLNTVLDFGCGDGSFLEGLNNRNIEAYGFEPLLNNDLANVCNNPKALSKFDNGFFDAITMWHSLEHVNSYAETISLLKPLIKQKGLLVIACPNYKSWDANHYKEYWAGYDAPRHIWHFSPKGLISFLESKGFVFLKRKMMFFDAFYVCMLSEKFKGTKFWFLKGFILGLYSNYISLFTKNPSSSVFVFQNQI
jgi:2-polyprenyl-3-methyl-5-hydroxy-6-metoxy-1,4-benzoquinol methylase